MSAKKRSADEGGVAVMARGGDAARAKRRLLAIVLLVAGVSGAGLIVWRQVRDHVLADARYQVLAEHVHVSPQPAWIRSDVAAEVLRDVTRTAPLTLLDADLTVRLAAAFAAHPWVARVDRVSKRFPAGVDVALAYRVPVAMVELHNGQGVLPVDEHGVVLPTRDDAGQPNFTPEEAERYPRVAEIFTTPSGPIGTRWGDAAVLGGAQLAAALAAHWKPLDLASVVPVERKPARTGIEYTFALVTRSGTRIFWGRAPGSDAGNEVSAEQKIAQLKRYAAQNGGTLDGPDFEIDPRGALLRKERPAVAPIPARDDVEASPEAG